ncbi:MAG: TetR/AcrR family transcriptional regulator [Lentimicrobium sp.]|nr:TetR/AcrR family transcriptional regulator [Lentimicrobium sp.]
METKERILIKAGELFRGLGIKNVTMDSLASDLGISKRIIYECFSHKDDLVISTMLYYIQNENEELSKIVNESKHVVEAMFKIIKHKRELLDSYSPLFKKDIARYLPRIIKLYYTRADDLKRYSLSYILLERGIKEGVFKEGINIKIVDSFLQDLMVTMHKSQRIVLLKPNEREILENIFIPYFKGLSTPKGIELMDEFFGKLEE